MYTYIKTIIHRQSNFLCKIRFSWSRAASQKKFQTLISLTTIVNRFNHIQKHILRQFPIINRSSWRGFDRADPQSKKSFEFPITTMITKYITTNTITNIRRVPLSVAFSLSYRTNVRLSCPKTWSGWLLISGCVSVFHFGKFDVWWG